MATPGWWARWAIVGAGGAVLALWLVDRGHPSLWTDEALTLRFSETAAAATSDFHPPLSYLLFWLWRMVVPDEVTWLRLLPTLLSLGAAACWSRFWWGHRRAGDLSTPAVVLAGALTVLSPHALLYGRMLRYFAPASVLLAATIALWWRALGDDRPRWALAGGAATGAALGLTSYATAASCALGLTAFVLLRRPAQLRRHMVLWSVAAAVTAVVVVASTLAPSPPAEAAGIRNVAVAALFPLWSATVGETINVFDLVIVVPAAAAWVVIGAMAVRRLRGAPDVVLLSAVLVAVALGGAVAATAVVGLEHTAAQAPKLFAPFAPALYLVAGWSLAHLVASGRRVLAWAAMAAVALAWLPGLVHLHDGTDFLYTSYALPWDDVTEQVDATVERDVEGDRSVAVLTVDPALSFLLADEGLRADVVEIEAAGGRVITAGAGRRGDYDVVLVVDRERVNAELDAALDAARTTLAANGYVVTESVGFGTVDPRLRRLHERLADRALADDLVTVVVYQRP